MIDLLSPTGREVLQRFVSKDILFAFDLDGTLAPIVADPTAVRIPEMIQQGMDTLSKLATTAIITGRSRSDALPRLGFKPRYLIGNHGAEGLPDAADEKRLLSFQVDGWERQLADLLSQDTRSATVLERKECSLSLHYRHAPDPDAAHRSLLEAITRLQPAPRRVGGKFVENLIPQEANHKGDALLHLLEYTGCPKAFFLGDDETDEDVFRLDAPQILSVCVGTDRPTAAHFSIQKQTDTAELIQLLIDTIKTTSAT